MTDVLSGSSLCVCFGDGMSDPSLDLRRTFHLTCFCKIERYYRPNHTAERVQIARAVATSTGKVKFNLEDLDKKCIPVMLWDDYVVEMRKVLTPRVNEPIVVVLQLCRINYFRTLGISNSYNATRLLINPSIPEVEVFTTSI